MAVRSLFVVVVIAVIVGLAGTARAQAPGETAPLGMDVMARRWSVEVGIGAASLKPKGGDQGTGFGLLGAAGRFRITPSIEVALGIMLGGGKRDDVDLATGGLYAELRYRFLADRPWNVFALAGLGVASIARKSPSDDEGKGRGMLRLGGGVEYRFGDFAIDATLRAIGIAEHADLAPTDMPDAATPFARFGVSGLVLAVDGLYYF